GLTANIINKTYPIIFGLKISNNVSTCKEAEIIINIAEINRIEISSLKCCMSATELVPVLAKVIPIAVTDNSPVPCTISSGNVKHKITVTNTIGDFKNSGTEPESNNKPMTRPHTQPKITEKIEAAKKISSEVPFGFSAVKYLIISNANTATKTPSGSTIIPSHFSIFDPLGVSFD